MYTMKAAKTNLSVNKYARYYREYQITDNGVPRNITGATIKMQFRKKLSDTVAAFNFAVGTGITVTNAALGKFAMDITSVQTATMDSNYRYDLTIDQGSGIDRLMEGEVLIIDGSTR